MQLDDTPVPAGQPDMRWREDPRGAGPWRDYSDDPANLDYPTSYAPAPRPAGYQPGYGGGYAARPRAGQPPWPPAPGRHAARHRGAPRRDLPEPIPPAAFAAAPGLGQRMRAAARNHTGAAALTAAAVVGAGVGAGMFGFAPFSSPAGTPSGATAAMPAAAPPVVSMAGSATPVQHHTGYLGKHRKADPRPTARSTHQLSASTGARGGAGTQTASPAPQSTGSGGSTPSGSSAPAPQPSASSTPQPSSSSGGGGGGQTGTGGGGGSGSGGGTGSGHGGSGHGGSGGLLGGLTGLLGGLGV